MVLLCSRYTSLRGQSPRRIEDVRTSRVVRASTLEDQVTQDSKVSVKTKSEREDFVTASTVTESGPRRLDDMQRVAERGEN